MKFGICEHRDGVLIEAVPDEKGYTLQELLKALKGKGPATFTPAAQHLLMKALYGREAA